MRRPVAPENLERILTLVESNGLRTHLVEGQERMIVGVIGDVRQIEESAVERLPGVERVVRIAQPFKLASRVYQNGGSEISISCHPSTSPSTIGGERLAIIAGPCTVEGRDMLMGTAAFVRENGGTGLRGGAYKPRTSPYSFQGLGEEGLMLLAEARAQTGLPIVTEVPAPEKVDLVSQHADVLQIGARNMQNFALLQEVGRCDRPVLLKRGMSASIEEWLMSAEYILARGNQKVILCERGIRTFENATRNTLDLSAVPVVKRLSHLPVLVDPSHGTGYVQYVAPMAMAAIAAGADGLLLETHPSPDSALCDGGQSLTHEQYAALISNLRPLAQVLGRVV
jgi:3-deoxy-7-phosphoheptulonate synthase